jgi:hypothetical protein
MGVNARQTKVGVNIATSGSWGTATAVGTGDGHYVRDDLGVQLRMNQSEDNAASQNFIGSVQTGTAAAITASLPVFLHYNDAWQNVLWALTLGTGGTAPAQVGTSTIYTNTFEPATNKTGRFATIVRDKVQHVSEIPSAKFTGFELRVGDQGRMEVDFSFVGNVEKSDSTVNTATQVSALTFPTLGRRAFFDDIVVRINTAGGGALGASDAINVTNMRVRFNQPLDALHIGGSTTIVEPEETGHPTAEIELTFARFDSTSDDYFASHRDTTTHKLDITATGPVIGTTATSYGLLMQFPNLYVSEYSAPIPGGAGQSAPRVTLRALSTTTAPTGMTGVTVPLRVVTTGISTTNPFA